MACLLLNATYEPIRVISAKRAVLLLVVEVAEMVEDSGECFHSAGGKVVPVPSVLRLLRRVKVPMRASLPITRRNVVARDNHRCAYCGGKADTVDHVKPRSRGGRHSWENVVAACKPCNSLKDDRTLAELGWKLPFKPYAPKGQLWIYAGLVEDDVRWRDYLGGGRVSYA